MTLAWLAPASGGRGGRLQSPRGGPVGGGVGLSWSNRQLVPQTSVEEDSCLQCSLPWGAHLWVHSGLSPASQPYLYFLVLKDLGNSHLPRAHSRA